MDQIWAPWRLEYIKKQGGEQSCPFCDAPAQGAGEETLVLYADKDIFVIQNKFPYNPGHLLIAPRSHEGDVCKLDPQVWLRLSKAITAAIEVLKKVYNPGGFNVGLNLGAIGGAGIPAHLHWHIVPRWGGDTNFMPVIAETKAIPTHNLSVYRQLSPEFSDFAKKL